MYSPKRHNQTHIKEASNRGLFYAYMLMKVNAFGRVRGLSIFAKQLR